MRFTSHSVIFLAPLILLIALIAAAPALAAPVWTSLGPYGGTVVSVIADPAHAGVAYAVSPGLGIFKSVNRGESWTLLAETPADCGALALDVTHPKVLYVSCLSGVHKSTDGGAHWALASPASLFAGTLTIDSSNPTRIYVDTPQGLWRSRDGGASWRPAGQGLPETDGTIITALAAPPRPAGTVFAATTRGLYKSLNYGVSWALVAALPTGHVTALAVSPSDPRTIFAALDFYGISRSTDGGASWTWTSMPWPRPGSVNSLAVDPRSSLTLYAGTESGLFKSTNGGRAWLPIGPGRSVFAAGVTIDPQAPDTVYAAAFSIGFEIGGILRSSDAGRTWIRSSTGIDGLFLTSAAVDAGDPDRLLAGLNSVGLFRSPNQGRRWVRSPLGVPREGPLLNIQSLAASPETPGSFAATAYPGDLVWKTVDGGLSWTRYSDFKSMWGIVRFDPARADTFFVMNRKGIFRGTMADAALVPVSGSPLGCSQTDLMVARGSRSGQPVLYAAGSGAIAPRCAAPTRSQVVRSTDGGATWAPADAGLPGEWVAGLAVDPENPEVLYARIGNDILGSSRGYGVWKTGDGGASWERAGEELRGQFVTALAVAPGRLFAATSEGKVFRSEDGGEHWQENGEGLPALWIAELLTTPAAPGRVYAVTSRGLWTLEAEP